MLIVISCVADIEAPTTTFEHRKKYIRSWEADCADQWMAKTVNFKKKGVVFLFVGHI